MGSLKLTKKAKTLAIQHELDLSQLPTGKIIRESDVMKLLEARESAPAVGSTATAREYPISDAFFKMLVDDASFGDIGSDLKIEILRKFGATIGDNVSIGKGTRLACREIVIGNDVRIGENGYIETDRLHLSDNTVLGDRQQWVASSIKTGAGLRSAHNVTIDVSGGKGFDSTLSVGKDCLLCEGVYVNVCKSVTLGDRVCLSPRSMVFTHSYWQSVLDGYDANFAPVALEKDSWVGGGAQVMPGSRVGSGATVMANSVVVGNVEDRTLVGGTPAILIKTYRHRPISLEMLSSKIVGVLNSRLPYLGWDSILREKSDALEFTVSAEDEITCIVFQRNPKKAISVDDYLGDHSQVVLVATGDDSPEAKAGTTVIHLKSMSISGVDNRLVKEVTEAFRRLGVKLHWK